MAELIQKTDNLNQGREKLNEAIKDADKAKVDAGTAKSTANQALTQSTNTQTQLDTIVIESGTSDAEVLQARVDEDGAGHTTLKARIDDGFTAVTTQLADESIERIVREKNSYHGYYEGAVVSFAFDDASIYDWTRFKPIFESEGVPGNVCVVKSWVGRTTPYQNLTWEQLKELKALGWSVASHTVNHRRVADMTENEIDFELRESSRVLQEHGLDHDIIVYPFGDVNDTVLKHARKYYKMGINIYRTNLSNDIPYLDNLNMVRAAGLSQPLSTGIEPTLAQCKATVDDAIANGKYIIFEDHSGYEIYSNPAKLEELRQLIQYIKSKGVPIVNLQDGFNMKCNIVDTWFNPNNYYRLHRNGKVTQSDLSYYTQSRSGTAFRDMSPNDFLLGKISVDRITGDLQHPEEVYKTTSQRFTFKLVDAPNSWYQEVINPNGKYIRYSNTTGDSWGEFKRIELGNNNKFQRLESSQFTVNAQSTHDLEINVPGLYFTDQVTIVPYGFANLPSGITFILYKTADNKLTLRFANITSSSVNVPAISWSLTTQRRL